jgi:carbohydrate diacid regulator
MISIHTVKKTIDELNAITKAKYAVYDLYGTLQVQTGDIETLNATTITDFISSDAESCEMGVHNLMKVYDDDEVMYVLDVSGNGEEVHTYGKIAVCSLQNLITAYKEKLDRTGFFQNLIMDNLLLVDIYNRAKKLHIETQTPRVAMLVETTPDTNSIAGELLLGMYTAQNGDYITSVDENNIVLIKKLDPDQGYDYIRQVADTIVDMMNTEVMTNVRVSYGTIVNELKDVSKSYKEAMMAQQVGKIFYSESRVAAYNSLGIGRLIYQLPENLCKMYVDEIFGENSKPDLDEEMISTINTFFENSLNISETSRQLYVHRNTLVYRIEKLLKQTGLDIRIFDDALTLKIAMMVFDYLKTKK